MTNTYSGERQALANALASHSMDRMQLGADMMANRSAQRTQQGMGAANLLGQLMNYNLAKEGLNIERNRGTVQYAAPVGPAAPAAPKTPFTGVNTDWTGVKQVNRSAHTPRIGVGAPHPLGRGMNTGRGGMQSLRRQTGAAPVPFYNPNNR